MNRLEQMKARLEKHKKKQKVEKEFGNLRQLERIIELENIVDQQKLTIHILHLRLAKDKVNTKHCVEKC